MRRFFAYHTAALSALILAPILWADAPTLDALIPAEQKAALLEKGSLTLIAKKPDAPELMPASADIQKLLASLTRDLDPNILTESLYLYKKPAAVRSAAWTAEQRASLYNNMLAISTLAGLQYYSERRNSMRVFYETSAVIDSPQTKNPLPDPSYRSPPPSLVLYARQKDLTFGDNLYQYDYFAYDGALALVQRNLTTMKAGPISAVKPENLRSVVAVIDAGDSLLIYAASVARTASLPGMKGRIGTSFANRADAVLGWFTKNADVTFGK